jgi:hypothetical protein
LADQSGPMRRSFLIFMLLVFVGLPVIKLIDFRNHLLQIGNAVPDVLNIAEIGAFLLGFSPIEL